MCVLYEDLRIELFGFSLKPDHPTVRTPDWSLDRAGFKVRQVYFFRRAIGTCSEFFEAIDLLNKDPDFRVVLESRGDEAIKGWEESASFFNRERQRYWKDIRNDVGGHFGAPAALFAVEALDPSLVGKVELHCAGPKEGGVVLSFSGEIAATALLKRLTAGLTIEEKIAGLIGEAQEVFRYATRAVQIIVVHYLWDKTK